MSELALSLRDASSEHLMAIGAANVSPATVRHYEYYERAFIAYVEAKGIRPNLEALTAPNVRALLEWMAQTPNGKRGGEATRYEQANILKVWCNWLVREELLDYSPLAKLATPKKTHFERLPFTPADVNAMLCAAANSQSPTRDRFVILLLLGTGMRAAEATGLTLGTFDMSRRRCCVLGKGSRERFIPFGDPGRGDGGPLVTAAQSWLDARKAVMLQSQRPEETHLIVDRTGEPLRPSSLYELIVRLGRVAKVTEPMPHRFRHTFATTYLTQFAGDEIGLRRILGHLSRDVLKNYIHLADEAIAHRAGKAAPLTEWLADAPPPLPQIPAARLGPPKQRSTHTYRVARERRWLRRGSDAPAQKARP